MAHGDPACPAEEPDLAGEHRAPPRCPTPPRTAQQMAHRGHTEHQRATDGVRDRIKYETLPDHLSDLAVSEILSSDRFKSTAAESYTFKRRERCLNPETIFSPAPPCDSVSYLSDVEERLRRSSLPASKPRFSEYSESFGARRLSCADMVGRVTLQRPCLSRPPTDPLPRHIYTATTGVAGEVNPLLSTTSKDFQPVSAAVARRYRDAPSGDTFTGDQILPPEPAQQPRWHGFTPSVPHGQRSEAQRRYRWRADQRFRIDGTAAPVVPPNFGQLGGTRFERESEGVGTGQHNAVALSSGGLASRRLCRLPPGEPRPGGSDGHGMGDIGAA